MHCVNCAASVKGTLESLPGVESCTVTLDEKVAVIKLKPGAKFPEAEARDKLDIDNFKLGARNEPVN
jgi:copper chaperone CopZ